VTGLRNCLDDSVQAVLKRAYIDTATVQPQIPTDIPKLLNQAYALHEIVKVDFFIPGCPPSAELINYVITELLSGRVPTLEGKFKYG
jgi:NAD-reducing hydrogenase small subunit